MVYSIEPGLPSESGLLKGVERREAQFLLRMSSGKVERFGYGVERAIRDKRTQKLYLNKAHHVILEECFYTWLPLIKLLHVPHFLDLSPRVADTVFL